MLGRLLGIFSDEPWFNWDDLPGMPNPFRWWDGLLDPLITWLKAIILLGLPGGLTGFGYALWVDRPLGAWSLGGAVISLVSVYGALYIWETCKDAVRLWRLRHSIAAARHEVFVRK